MVKKRILDENDIRAMTIEEIDMIITTPVMGEDIDDDNIPDTLIPIYEIASDEDIDSIIDGLF